MEVVKSYNELWAARELLPEPLALVPTMGFLHEGHLSLVRAAKARAASVVVSIYVNPTQFNQAADLEVYPRNLDRDLELLEKEGVDLVWAPDNQVMYPENFQTWVEVGEISKVLEGEKRPGHFRGVTTIVSKLFTAVQPQLAFFGQKDAQQVAVIRQMTNDLNFPIEIVVAPLIREHDGLAMSSRNVNLDPQERLAAVALFRALSAAKAAYLSGERNAERLRSSMKTSLNKEPLAKIDYVSCADQRSLQELDTVTEGALLSMAVFIGDTRLIDNMLLEP